MSKSRVSATSPAVPDRPARPRRAPLRPHVLAAVCARDFLGYFSNPAGYVFLALFAVVCAWAQFWQPVFFANNLANLTPLNDWMPYILLFFIPAITMSTWAEERKQGTEELLLTLPARDVEVVLGKYFAALGIYTVAILILAFEDVGFLRQIGSPDLGIMAANYLGCWLMGGMLIAFGMVASILTNNATVGFILGGVFGAVPVFAKLAAAFAPAGPWRRLVEGLSVSEQFRDFGSGVVTVSGVLYFVTLAAAMLYLNMVLVGRRHWAGGEESKGRGLHAAARVAAVVVALAGLDVLAGKTMGSWRFDLTQERLHTLTPASLKIIRAIPDDRPVFIDAYISTEVPREYVQTRLDLIDTLKEFAALGGPKIRLNLVSAERFSPAARDAEKRFGIAPKEVRTVDNARQDFTEITLGVAFTSGLEEVVVPFFDRGLPVEYEVARSVRVASGTARKRVGILSTDANLMPGMAFSQRGMNADEPWSVVTELKKQYDVTTVSADAPIPTNLDALIVAQPSSLTERQLPNLTTFIRGGGPTLLLLDPYPGLVSVPDLAPREAKKPPGGMFAGGPPPEPKGNLRPLLGMLGIVWEDDQIVWNPYNPYKKYQFPREVVFIARDATPGSFGDDPTTSGLQTLFLPFCGDLAPLAGATTKFVPLLMTDDTGGAVAYSELFQSSPFGMQALPPPQLIPSHHSYIAAARVSGPLPPEPAPKPEPGDPAPPKAAASAPGRADVIAIADLDLIADQIFRLRLKSNEAYDELDFDNVSFLLNCVDSLADEESFIPLRGRKAKHRTLKAVEDQEKAYVTKADEEAKAADADAKKQLSAANASLQAQVEAVRADKGLDEREKQRELSYREAVERRKLDVATAEIEDQKKSRIKDAQAASKGSKDAIENGIRVITLLTSPLPAILLGALVFIARKKNENVGATPARLA